MGWWPTKKVVPVMQRVPVTPRVTVEAFLDEDSIPISLYDPNFPVVLQVRPPKLKASTATPIDFVAVLDISASMTKEMVQHFEQAMLAVVDDHLIIGPEDRFSMVSWSSEVQRCTQLTQMSRHGLEAAFSEVNNTLVGAGKSDVPAALQQAVQIIKARESDDESINRNSFIVLFSAGGHDSIKHCEFPVYSIGLPNHDPQAMCQTADATGVPYNYVNTELEKMSSVLGKLIKEEKTIIGTNIKIPFRIHDGVRKVMKIDSGGHKQYAIDNQHHVVEINRLYAGQDHIDITVYLHVLEGETLQLHKKLSADSGKKMKLMTVGGKDEGIHHVDKPVDVFVKRTSGNNNNNVRRPKPCNVASDELARLRLVRGFSDLLAKKNKPTAAELETLYSKFLESEGGRDLASKWKLEQDIREMQKGISDANTYKMQGLPYMLSWLSSHKWQRATAKGSPFIPDNFLPTSTLQQHTSPFIPNNSFLLSTSTLGRHTMCRAALLQLIPSAISAALVILLLAVLFGFHTGILKSLWPALQLVMGYSTLVTAMNRAIQQYLYSAFTYSVILGACATFVTTTKEVVSIERRAQKLEKEKDEEDMKIFKQNDLLSERANTTAYPNACGGRAAGMSTVQISEMVVGLAVAT